MKKIFVLLIAVITIGIIMISCKAAEKCPAYGEAKKYQIEQRY
jgi:hypothetical protein